MPGRRNPSSKKSTQPAKSIAKARMGNTIMTERQAANLLSRTGGLTKEQREYLKQLAAKRK